MRNVNPFTEVYKRRRYRSGEKSLTPAQIQQFLEVVSDLVHLGLFQVALSTGIRREDIVRIRVKDIDFETQSITFYESKKNRTKTVYIPKNVVNTLQMIRRVNKNEVYIFPGASERKRGKGHMSGKTAYNLFNKYLQKAGLSPRPFHALRATCIKLCQAKGWTIEQTAEHVGDTIRVIQEHYTTPSIEEMREVVNEKSLI